MAFDPTVDSCPISTCNAVTGTNCPLATNCDDEEKWACVDASMQYLYSLYWSIATVTGIGYGDVVATPLHPTEQVPATTLA